MLDATTRRRIDSARDILVGKVPDPKSQVEQITIALIYKFMDDIDLEAEELGGGGRTFFAGEFAQYSWANLLHKGLGGQEMLNRYGEAITRMNENRAIPPLFRDIFKNAYLPYRDPETLRAFLKIIDEFAYDHSERLGDAFEYLLSVLGSQGDAGQFRTPRHIIDFIVAIVNPQKHEKVLDPACGTAGFLISAYKHILAANRDAHKNSTLSSDEQRRLVGNFTGYDISPDMVRLSLVNMYLHRFPNPTILEFDTLTSEDHWNERFDVILANPPFMTPKGGIRPHNRFGVKSNRSEVLFVDYIAEHLSRDGRAGIIVPEGVIFQSQNAYKQLRKMLVEKYLVAVVSLPAGVFNPYSGVKTSILILEPALARNADTIGFFKIENDGYGLGAQRRAIEANDLPTAQREIEAYLGMLRAGESLEGFAPTLGHVVAKEKIAANGEYNLSGERYRENGKSDIEFPWTSIGSHIVTITPPAKVQKVDFLTAGKFPVIDQSQQAIAGWTDDEDALITPTKPLVVFGDHTCAVKLVDFPFAQGADGIKILSTTDELDPHYLFRTLRGKPLESNGYQRHFGLLKEMSIPLPPLEVQRAIVAEIEGYQKVIDGARAVVENYRPHIHVEAEWPIVQLGDVCRLGRGFAFKSEDYVSEGILNFRVSNIGTDRLPDLNNCVFLPQRFLTEYAEYQLEEGDFVIVMVGATTGKLGYITANILPALLNQNMWRFHPDESVLNKRFLYYAINQLPLFRHGAARDYLRQSDFVKNSIPLPPLETQRAIVAEIEAEQALVNGNRELITRMQAKIDATLARVWGEA